MTTRKNRKHNLPETIPHQLDIRTSNELYAAMIAFPLVGCYWEASCLIDSHTSENEPVGMMKWQAHWWDACSYNLGFSLTRLLADISVPELWHSPQAKLGYPEALEEIKTAAIDSYLTHDGNYLLSLECLMARLGQTVKTIEMKHGYPHKLLETAASETSHAAGSERHQRKCLS